MPTLKTPWVRQCAHNIIVHRLIVNFFSAPDDGIKSRMRSTDLEELTFILETAIATQARQISKLMTLIASKTNFKYIVNIIIITRKEQTNDLLGK